MFGAFVLVRLPSLLTASESTNAELAAAIRLAYLIVGLSSMCVAVLLAVTLKPRHADFFTCDFWRTHYAMARRAVTNRWHGTADKRDSAEVANRNVADEKGVTATATGMPPGHSGVGVASEDSVVARCPYLAHQQQPKQQSSPSNSGEFASLRKTSTASSIPGEETAFLGQPKSGSASTNDNAAQLGCTMPGVLEQTEAAKREGMWSLIWKGFQLGWRSPYIMLAYLGGMSSKGAGIDAKHFSSFADIRYGPQASLRAVTASSSHSSFRSGSMPTTRRMGCVAHTPTILPPTRPPTAAPRPLPRPPSTAASRKLALYSAHRSLASLPTVSRTAGPCPFSSLPSSRSRATSPSSF